MLDIFSAIACSNPKCRGKPDDDVAGEETDISAERSVFMQPSGKYSLPVIYPHLN
jgi:hypothetical protein